jgi:tetratricopeptide (TPR) repeat protein
MKKNRLLWLLFILFGINGLFAQAPEEYLTKANKAYEKNDYKTAIETYSNILHNGYENGELFYNLGNAYFKTGQFANAILNYERAKKYLPNDEDLKHNIAIANLRIPDRLEKVPKLFIFEWWDSLKNLFPLSFYQIFVFILFTILIIFITLFFWSHDYSFRKKVFFIGLFYSIIFVLVSAAFISKAVELDSKRSAVVFSQTVDMKSSPDESSTTLYMIHYGLKVDILDELENWYRVILPDGKTGWIKTSNVTII